SEMLDLPHFISYGSAMLCHSKHLMRGALGSDFEGNVEFMVCSSAEEATEWDSFPAMMKPVDSQGQRGCFRVDSAEDIKEHFETSISFSSEGKVIIESYIDGPEISVNSYRANGRTVFAVTSDRESFEEYPGGLPKLHRIPSTFASDEAKAEAADIVDRAADRLGITDGPCYCQMKLGRDGRPYIIEIAPRLDGCHMWDLIKHWCGVDLLNACFSHLLTEDPGITQSEAEASGVMELVFLSEKTGASFDPDKYDLSGAEKTLFYYEKGDTVGRVNGYFEKCGYMIRRIR
ncbi:MAG: ATP-grasp domain-containing protein, partial [Clostridiales bacterium]|nr:ATP-grasp domain-containing protein [Clostridiales bacterium]